MAVKTLERGDVLAIPVGDGRTAFGYVVHSKAPGDTYVVVFEQLHGADTEFPDLEQLVAGPLRLGAWTDAEFVEAGRWLIIGNVPVRRGFPMPAYKVAIDRPGNFYVEDWTGTKRRPATDAEAALLPNRSSFSAGAVERAVRGTLGMVQWHDILDRTLLKGLTSQEAFPDDAE